MRRVVASSAARVVLSFSDGSWTDDVSAQRLVLDVDGDRVTLSLELVPTSAAFSERIGKCHAIDFIQITKSRARKPLRRAFQQIENPDVNVMLLGRGRGAVYPATVVFGPDAITLNLG